MEKNHGWSWDTNNGIPFMNGPMNQAPLAARKSPKHSQKGGIVQPSMAMIRGGHHQIFTCCSDGDGS